MPSSIPLNARNLSLDYKLRSSACDLFTLKTKRPNHEKYAFLLRVRLSTTELSSSARRYRIIIKIKANHHSFITKLGRAAYRTIDNVILRAETCTKTGFISKPGL